MIGGMNQNTQQDSDTPETVSSAWGVGRDGLTIAVGFDRVEGDAIARGQAIAFYGDDSRLSIDEDGEFFEAHLSTVRRSVIAPPRAPRRPRSRLRRWFDLHVRRGMRARWR
jgi:hypothetical protein